MKIPPSSFAVMSAVALTGGAGTVATSLSPNFAERIIHDEHHKQFFAETIQNYNSDRSIKPLFSTSSTVFALQNPQPQPQNRHGKDNESSVQEHPRNALRRLEDTDTNAMACDVAFMSCLMSDKCTQCFTDMTDKAIDWSIIAPDTPCEGVLDVLISKGNVCTDLQAVGSDDRTTFCKAFDNCVIWNTDQKENDEDDGNDSSNPEPAKIDCDSLTSCDFDGFKPNYIGDGICHEFIGGCYNSAICGYDGGDCCVDTCVNKTSPEDGKESFHLGCGTDGYFCRDPNSKECITKECKKKNADGGGDGDRGDDNNDNNKPINPSAANCTKEETPYRLFQYDSFGDGWDLTEMMISSNEGKDLVYDGRLENGSEGMEIICLMNIPTCYSASLSGGYWGNEVSWEIKPMKNGAPAIASGGSPMECSFPIGAEESNCPATCNGKANVDPAEDEKYQSFHRMVNCIEDKCLLQIETCKMDLVCASCLEVETAPAYCLASNMYNALVFCTECNCIEDIDADEKKKFCEEKSRDPHENEDVVADDDGEEGGGAQECSFNDFMDGTDALIQYKMCSGIDTSYALVTEFDNDNFGMLDSFESCAHDYHKDKYGKSALDCMSILQDAINHPLVDPSRKDVPTAAIQNLADDLFNHGEEFCDCSVKASQKTPPCTDFIRFKTLLYESLDGCRALDEIDCPAWGEFYGQCHANVIDKFGVVDFRNSETCEYVRDRCGNVGPFPSFRRLDCDEEGVSKDAWDFYLKYEANCMKAGPAPAPKPAPEPKKFTPSPTASSPTAPSPSGSGSNPTPYNPSSGGEKKKYIPPEERGKKGGGKKFFKFLLLCAIIGGAYYVYKKRIGGFDYASFRRTRNYYADDNSGMYDTLNLQTTGEASFMPPSLPPPPSAYGPQNNYSYPNNNPA